MPTVTVPGIGPVEKKYLYVGGAAILGFVAYEWYRNSQSTGAAQDQAAADQYSLDQETTPDSYDPYYSGDSTYSNEDTSESTTTWTTNADWITAAEDIAGSLGISSSTAASVLNKWLSGQQLTQDEANQVNSIRAAMGTDPPQGGPYPVKISTGASAKQLNAPLVKVASTTKKSTAAVSWGKLTSAAYYEVQARSEPKYGSGKWTGYSQFASHATGTSANVGPLNNNKVYQFRVRGYDSSGNPGKWGAATTQVKY